MRRELLFMAASLSFLSTSYTQVTNTGGPVSWKGKLNSHIIIPTAEMPEFDLAAIQAEDEINDQTKSAPWRFGYKYNTDFTFDSGIWTDLPGGNRVWRMGIIAEGALTVNLLFENVYFPKGAHLYLYDADKTQTVGAYTERNNHPTGELGTELIHGDHIIVEYFEPAEVAGQGHFTISDVVHGYRSLNIIQGTLAKALNSSGDCNIDARCEIDPYVGGISAWDDQIRSVAMIVVSGSAVCSGALINNTCNDGTPYFLTANHCLGGSTGNWAFRFNWDVPEGHPGMSCATTANTPTSFNNSANYDETANGATVLVSGTAADHALLRIDNMTLADAQNWNLFYAGWDHSDVETAVTEVTGIHHPAGDIKKICRADDSGNGIFHANNGAAATWEIDSWEEGVTEPGSSGSPLFDQNGRIIGQLYGGLAACASNPSTQNNGLFDYYGRLGISWGLGIGTYLAPASCGSATTDDGWDASLPATPDNAGIMAVSVPSGNICSDNFIPEVVLKNFGLNDLTSVTINYDIDGGTNNTFNWTGTLAPSTSVTVTLPGITTTVGAHVFNVSTSAPNGNPVDSNPVNDASLSNYNATIGGQPVTFKIDTDCWGYEIYWEIADLNSNIVQSGGNTSGIPPGGAQSAALGDPGAYGPLMTVTETFCLTDGCYNLTIYDDWGDGLNGTAFGCAVDGNYSLMDGSMTVLAEMTVADYGNSDTTLFCLNPPCNSTFDYTTVEEDCFGDTDGSITVNFLTGNATGATYNITGNIPQTSNTLTGLTQEDYIVEIVDGDACTSFLMVTLGGPTTALNGTVTENNISCNGQIDGELVVSGTGGTPAYTYDIGNGPVANGTFSGLGDGNYTITIVDANMCTATVSGTITEPAILSASAGTITPEMTGNDGSVDLIVSGGTTPYTYSWTGPNGYTNSTQDPNNMPSGTYAVTVTDNRGCSTTISGIIVLSEVGLDALEASGFVVYPNPGTGVFNVTFTETDHRAIVVTDVTGRTVYEAAHTQTTFTVDLNSAAEGTYFLNIYTTAETITTPIVVKR